MPFALDPNQTTDIVLETDQAKPPDKRPSFTARFLTCRQTCRVDALLEEARQAKSDSEAAPRLSQAIAIGIVGWKHIDRPFSVDVLEDVLTVGEMWELAYKILSATQLAESELKKSLSPSASATGAAVPTPQTASA